MEGSNILPTTNSPSHEGIPMATVSGIPQDLGSVPALTPEQPESLTSSSPSRSSVSLDQESAQSHDAEPTGSFPPVFSEPPPESVEIFNAVFYRGERTFCLPERLLSALSRELHGPRLKRDLLHMTSLDVALFLGTFVKERYMSPTAYGGYLRCLIQFLTDGEGAKHVDDFINALRQDPEWNQDVHEVKRASCVFEYALGFGTDTPILDFKGHIIRLFPRRPWSRHPPSFSLSLADIQAVGLVVKPTSRLEEHLQMKNNIVSVLAMTPSKCKTLKEYESNRVATALELGTLGHEIFGSLRALYDNEQTYAEASALGLISNASPDFRRILQLNFLLGIPPKILASRAHALESAVRYRRKWLPSLLRDVNASRKDKPFFFWGSMLAIGFGTCQVIQTIATIWALVIAIRMEKHS